MIEEPEVLEVARERYAEWMDAYARRRRATPSTRGWCGSRRTVCGIPTSSASPPPRATIAAA